jgi:allantoin racemase
MKLCYLEMNPEANAPTNLRTALTKLLERAARPGTTVEVRFPKESLGGAGVDSSTFNAAYVALLKQAEQDGFDGVLMGGFYIPSLYEARRVCRIPAVSPAESAMLMAHLIGARYAILAYPGQLIRPLIERLIDQFGFRGKAILNPVRFVGYPESDLWKIGKGLDPTPMVRSFVQVGKQALEDGAEVIIPGCTATSLIHDSISHELEEIGVPVLSPVQAELKVVEMLVDLQKNLGFFVSRCGVFSQQIP